MTSSATPAWSLAAGPGRPTALAVLLERHHLMVRVVIARLVGRIDLIGDALQEAGWT